MRAEINAPELAQLADLQVGILSPLLTKRAYDVLANTPVCIAPFAVLMKSKACWR